SQNAAHTHTVSGTAASAGAHTHTQGTGSGSGYVNHANGTLQGYVNTSSAGAHTHTVSGTAASSGGAEGWPRHAEVLFCIKCEGGG
ncbi:MAG: hypothetical protein LBI31_07535, partial [Zoogloeaceae bacterium]|nr:hypothetical protein [Zoogloeaceae bacterium]